MEAVPKLGLPSTIDNRPTTKYNRTGAQNRSARQIVRVLPMPMPNTNPRNRCQTQIRGIGPSGQRPHGARARGGGGGGQGEPLAG